MTYGELLGDLEQWTSNSDPSFLASRNRFIRQAEARIGMLVKLPNYNVTSTISISANTPTATLPTGLIAVDYISLPGHGMLEKKDASFIREAYPSSNSGSGTNVFDETPSGAVNGSNTTFTLANTPSPTSSLLLFNGELLTQGIDYTLSGGSTITFTSAPSTGSNIRAFYSTAPSGGVAYTGQPRYWAFLTDTTILLGPTPDQGYTATIEGFGKWPSLVDLGANLATVNNQTFISQNFEPALLHGCLMYAHLYMQNVEQAQMEKQEFEESLGLVDKYGKGKAKRQEAEKGSSAVESGDAN